jgi:hypothetical protein
MWGRDTVVAEIYGCSTHGISQDTEKVQEMDWLDITGRKVQ